MSIRNTILGDFNSPNITVLFNSDGLMVFSGKIEIFIFSRCAHVNTHSYPHTSIAWWSMHHVVSSLEQDKISLIHRYILDWNLKCIHEAGIYCTTAVHPTTIHLVTSYVCAQSLERDTGHPKWIIYDLCFQEAYHIRNT